MDRKVKRILFVTDDWSETTIRHTKPTLEQGDFFYTTNWLRFEFVFIRSLDEYQGTSHDAALIDYGLIGEGKGKEGRENIRILKDIYHACDQRLVWVGGLGDLVQDDIEEQFGNRTWMQGHPCCTTGTDEILGTLYYIFKSEAPLRETSP